jgi:hypothetical protein
LVPILVRPVREQLEHDRIIRLLEAKWRRKFKVDANPGDERNVGVKVPAGTLYPDLILTEEGGRKPKALVEVETNESVNHLEAMAQWANLAKSRTSLFLFVPVGAVEAARRLASESSVKLAELWTYLVLGDQVRFTSVFREDGAEPADLIEKVEVFTTERPPPAPRPIAVEPVASVEAPAAEPERPRKLAVKAGSRPVDGVAAKLAAKIAAKVAAKGATPAVTAEPEPAAKPTVSGKVAAAKPEPKAEPAKVAVKPPPVKASPAVKAMPPAKAAAPPVAAKAPVKGAVAKAVVAKPADKVPAKPTDKVPAKAGEKPGAKKAAAKPELKKAPVKTPLAKAAAAKAAPTKPAAKSAPVKATAVVKKPAAAKPAPRPAAHKAGPARPAARVVAPAKKAPPAAKAPASKRK